MPDAFLDTVGQPAFIADTGKTLRLGAGGLLGATFNTDASLTVDVGIAVKTGLTNITTAADVTYSAAQLLTGLITRDANGGARADLIDTAANLIAGIPALSKDGAVWSCYLINSGASTLTITTNTGLTIQNTGQTIATNESCILLLRRTSSTAVTVYVVGA